MLNINKTAIKPSRNEKTIEVAKSWRVKGLGKKIFFSHEFYTLPSKSDKQLQNAVCSVFVSAFLSTEVIYDKFEHLYTSQSPALMLQNKQLVLINLSCKKWLPVTVSKEEVCKESYC